MMNEPDMQDDLSNIGFCVKFYVGMLVGVVACVALGFGALLAIWW